ncbi:MAG TPA: hypothetical protein VK949_04690 [Methylotenera sp.]|nr:hypothetical protein [Methylotenera sp.]
MPKYKIDEAIQYGLAQHIDKSSDVNAVTDTMVNLCQQVAQRLDPVIGMHGTEVIFSRSLKLINKDYPWLVMKDTQSNSADRIHDFLKAFEYKHASQVTKASYRLLLTFSQILVDLIGESLTSRLLNPVFIPSAAGNPKNN